jgi:type I restriction enzyme R subunit
MSLSCISSVNLRKRMLHQYGYPPDMQKLATETVLKQAELIADELSRVA